MGLDYTFVTIIPKHQLEHVYAYVRNHGVIHSGNSASIHFPLDSFILKYLEGGYSWRPHYDQEEIELHMEPGGKASIGGIDLSTRELEDYPDEIEVSFTAVTSDMSRLFQDSVSISQWFVGLSKSCDAVLTYIDLEDEGARIIFCHGTEVHLELRGNNHLADFRETFFEMMTAFYNRYPHFE
ncbi:hypothetical protein ACX93W_26995 [Paenibacillus sp. CAU 1782]